MDYFIHVSNEGSKRENELKEKKKKFYEPILKMSAQVYRNDRFTIGFSLNVFHCLPHNFFQIPATYTYNLHT